MQSAQPIRQEIISGLKELRQKEIDVERSKGFIIFQIENVIFEPGFMREIQKKCKAEELNFKTELKAVKEELDKIYNTMQKEYDDAKTEIIKIIIHNHAPKEEITNKKDKNKIKELEEKMQNMKIPKLNAFRRATLFRWFLIETTNIISEKNEREKIMRHLCRLKEDEFFEQRQKLELLD